MKKNLPSGRKRKPELSSKAVFIGCRVGIFYPIFIYCTNQFELVFVVTYCEWVRFILMITGWS